MADSILPETVTVHNTGIYKITNTANGKFYVGSAVNIKQRFAQHRSSFKYNKHDNNYLQKAWNKYGKQVFKLEVILYCDSENMLFYEQRILDMCFKLQRTRIYNICPIAGNCMGRPVTPQTREKISNGNKGKPSYMKGRTHSEEARQKISQAHKGKPSPNLGKKASLETRQKQSLAKKGRPSAFLGKSHSPESKEVMARTYFKKGHDTWNKGCKGVSEATQQKLSISHKGIKYSEETCRKHSEAAKKHWARQKALNIPGKLKALGD